MTNGIEGKKALVTGASGFIGGRLRDALLARGVDVVAIRRADSPTSTRGRSVVGDYGDVESLVRIFREERPDYVFHVAGATKGVTYEDFRSGNVTPTRNLLVAARTAATPLSRFVLVSSLSVYGPSTKARPMRETDPRRPIEHYGESKLEAEKLLEAETEIPWTIIRPAGVYGPGDVDYLNLFKSAASGLNVFYGNRDRLGSHVYVDDVVDAIIASATAPSAAGKGYFVSEGEPMAWDAFQEVLVRHAGRRVLTLDLPEFLVPLAARVGEIATAIDKKPRLFNLQKAKMGEQEAWTCTHEAATRDFGFAPKVGVDEGVRRTFAWYRENGWL